MRGIIVQETLRFLREFDADAGEAVRRAVDPQALAAVDAATSTDWVDLAHDREVLEQITEVLGVERADDFFAWELARHSDGRLLRSTVSAVKRLLGLSPATLVKAIPVAWPLVYRDFGLIRSHQADARHYSIIVEQAHPEVMEHPVHAASLRATFVGVFALVGAAGTVDVEIDRASSTIRWGLRWDASG